LQELGAVLGVALRCDRRAATRPGLRCPSPPLSKSTLRALGLIQGWCRAAGAAVRAAAGAERAGITSVPRPAIRRDTRGAAAAAAAAAASTRQPLNVWFSRAGSFSASVIFRFLPTFFTGGHPLWCRCFIHTSQKSLVRHPASFESLSVTMSATIVDDNDLRADAEDAKEVEQQPRSGALPGGVQQQRQVAE